MKSELSRYLVIGSSAEEDVLLATVALTSRYRSAFPWMTAKQMALWRNPPSHGGRALTLPLASPVLSGDNGTNGATVRLPFSVMTNDRSWSVAVLTLL